MMNTSVAEWIQSFADSCDTKQIDGASEEKSYSQTLFFIKWTDKVRERKSHGKT